MVRKKEEIKTVKELVESGIFGNRTEEVKRVLRERMMGGYK